MTTTRETLSSRSRIEMRWSTSPSDLGYGNSPSPAPMQIPGPTYYGSPRQVLAEIARVRHNVGEGTYLRIDLAHRGNEISVDAVRECVLDQECRHSS